jgi:hypothetical protein
LTLKSAAVKLKPAVSRMFTVEVDGVPRAPDRLMPLRATVNALSASSVPSSRIGMVNVLSAMSPATQVREPVPDGGP